MRQINRCKVWGMRLAIAGVLIGFVGYLGETAWVAVAGVALLALGALPFVLLPVLPKALWHRTSGQAPMPTDTESPLIVDKDKRHGGRIY